jgi:hypothetical protein
MTEEKKQESIQRIAAGGLICKNEGARQLLSVTDNIHETMTKSLWPMIQDEIREQAVIDEISGIKNHQNVDCREHGHGLF